jgi:tRNA nucleotidyltransferase/poly(A) polymerase
MMDNMDSRISDIARAVAAAGGRAVLVGGYVRDRLLGAVAGRGRRAAERLR